MKKDEKNREMDHVEKYKNMQKKEEKAKQRGETKAKRGNTRGHKTKQRGDKLENSKKNAIKEHRENKRMKYGTRTEKMEKEENKEDNKSNDTGSTSARVSLPGFSCRVLQTVASTNEVASIPPSTHDPFSFSWTQNSLEERRHAHYPLF